MKLQGKGNPTDSPESRPARGAWIETPEKEEEHRKKLVAPRAGRVD